MVALRASRRWYVPRCRLAFGRSRVYLEAMATSRISTELRRVQREAERERPSDVLLAEALSLGLDGLAAYARSAGCSLTEARRRLGVARQRGRTPSRVLLNAG